MLGLCASLPVFPPRAHLPPSSAGARELPQRARPAAAAAAERKMCCTAKYAEAAAPARSSAAEKAPTGASSSSTTAAAAGVGGAPGQQGIPPPPPPPGQQGIPGNPFISNPLLASSYVTEGSRPKGGAITDRALPSPNFFWLSLTNFRSSQIQITILILL